MKRDANLDLEMCNNADEREIWAAHRCVLEDIEGCLIKDDQKFIAESREALPYWINRAVKAEELLKEIQDYLMAPKSKYGGAWPEWFDARIKVILNQEEP